ncbi:gluconokinase [Opitutus sp. ER46]|uniref:gluconokinase n=1 Tax=Opitutus sp. ER46 TaxID=2161864 RepID=UPI0018EEC60D|nr:gluconokinase [Opitutus sp. ER46]
MAVPAARVTSTTPTPPSPPVPPPGVILVMGVAGSGKSTIGRRLAADLGWSFLDADDLHPPANRTKMQAGQPLTDADRLPWLQALRQHIDAALATNTPVVLACSALRESYRQLLRTDDSRVRLVHLTGAPALLQSRLAGRTGHFFPGHLLDTQLATLEPPHGALTIDVTPPPAAIVASVRHALSL